MRACTTANRCGADTEQLILDLDVVVQLAGEKAGHSVARKQLGVRARCPVSETTAKTLARSALSILADCKIASDRAIAAVVAQKG